MKTPSLQIPNPPSKPLLVYDGDCGFCLKWVDRWRALAGDRFFYEPYQKMVTIYPSIPLEHFQKAVQLIEPNGRVTQAAEAVFTTMGSVWFFHWLLWLYRYLPGFRWLAERGYSYVADHRHLFSTMESCETPAKTPDPKTKKVK